MNPTYKEILVKIATPSSVGMGFILMSGNVIITCEHIIRGHEKVVVQSQFGKEYVKVLYLDSVLDIAFLALPNTWKTNNLAIANLRSIETEIPVWIADIPIGSFQNIMKTELMDTIEQSDKITYLELDVPIVSDQSGSPVLDAKNRILGLNSALYTINNTFAFALSGDYLIHSLIHYQKYQLQFPQSTIIKCYDCKKIIAENEISNQKCPKCQAALVIEKDDYEPYGIARTIENLLEQTGYQIELSRKGPSAWEVEQGSATIQIIYNEKDGYIIGDAILCQLPEQPSEELYEFLLAQNYLLKGLNFSVKGVDIVLSLLIFERDLNMETGSILFKNLFEQADYYDNVLVEEYGAKWLFEN
jgi:serine protease Do